MSVQSHAVPAVFTPEAVASINRAYAEALAIVSAEESSEQRRHQLAQHMMVLARNGETNEARLCTLSVMAVLGRIPSKRHEGTAGAAVQPRG